MSEQLTRRQLEILFYMHANARVRYPTVREIAAHFGIWPATVQDHINALRRKGRFPESEKVSVFLSKLSTLGKIKAG
jgi:DNA-binding MarR family transcriptional regulator